MSFPGTNQRRFNAGGAPASPSARPPRDGGDGGGEKKSKWTTVGCFYDPWHASLEPQVLTEWFKTGLGLKVAPVFPDRAGSEPGAAGTPKYDHDSAVMLLLKLEEVLTFRYQLAAFLSGPSPRSSSPATRAPGPSSASSSRPARPTTSPRTRSTRSAGSGAASFWRWSRTPPTPRTSSGPPSSAGRWSSSWRMARRAR